MKELWLMCNSSLYCNFIDQNEQRINDGEIDLMLFPSEVFPFTSCRLPLDLNNQEELTSCIRSGYGQYDRLHDLFNELANLNTDKYDKIGIYIEKSANDTMFGNMIHYFIDAKIFVRNATVNQEYVLPADTIKGVKKDYQYYACKDDSFFIFDGEVINHVPNLGIEIVLLTVINSEYESVRKVIDVYKEHFDKFDDLHPLFIASMMRTIVHNGMIKGKINGVDYTQETILDSDLHSFYQSAEVRALNSDEQKVMTKKLKKEIGKMLLKKTA